MSKYIDAEKLIAEIERLKDKFGNYKPKNATEHCYRGGRLIGYQDVLYKITSLQQEQPEVDLEKEVKSYIKENFTITDEVVQIPEQDRMYSMGEDDMTAFARHFWNKGYNARKEE